MHCQALQRGQTCVEHLGQGNGPGGLLLSAPSVMPPGRLRVGIFPQTFPTTTPVPQQQCPAQRVHCRGDANANLATMGGGTTHPAWSMGSPGTSAPYHHKVLPSRWENLGVQPLALSWHHSGLWDGFSSETLHGKTQSHPRHVQGAKGTSQPVKTSSAYQGCRVWCWV